jgi:hypothetical protein
MQNRRIFFYIFILVFLVAAAYFISSMRKKPAVRVTSFEECTQAGYPVMQSYPEQCTTPQGKIFMKQVIEEQR